MVDYSKNFEFIGDFVVCGQKCKQIKCVKEYYDFYAKRTIKVGELGGYASISITKHIKNWIDIDSMVGDFITENCSVQIEKKEIIGHSNVKILYDLVNNMISNWWWKAETKTPSVVNAIIYKSSLIKKFIIELFNKEEICIKQTSNISETERILLWTLLGAIQEAILKVHITVCREKFSNFLQKEDLNKIDNIKVPKIINEMENKNEITNEEKIVLETINSNRNMIHFISNRPIHNYNKYINSIDDFVLIAKKIFGNQQKFLTK
ncbi:MAG: hypothetical protein IJA15_04250 [Clostridia bacterium]|nr:hypothetical protein [Clostridia bacterium]